MNRKNVPEINGLLRSHMIRLPDEIRDAGGIKVFGKKIKSFVFTTDVAVIKNTNIYSTAYYYTSISDRSRYSCVLWRWWWYNHWY